MVLIVRGKVPQQVRQQQLRKRSLAGGHPAAGAQRRGGCMRRQSVGKAAHPLLVAAGVQVQQLRISQRIRLLCHRRRRCGVSSRGVALRIDLQVGALRCIQLGQRSSTFLSSKQPPASTAASLKSGSRCVRLQSICVQETIVHT